jgi:hypothetical protein
MDIPTRAYYEKLAREYVEALTMLHGQAREIEKLTADKARLELEIQSLTGTIDKLRWTIDQIHNL